ncbi:site-specific integrase [Svornostia abyssi]|uniref:Site-specific integrase n=1 Tax=Svornostia abyssi TaxID=2898438 RepID=A0ABY5PBY8_9ACTN|nr:site-specific integrase [Parviterribacteraceae bacterium J379]
MQAKGTPRVSGHVFVMERASGRVYYAKWRDADGQHKRRLGPAWVKPDGKDERGGTRWKAASGTKPPGYLTPRDAQDELTQIKARVAHASAQRQQLGPLFRDAADEWLSHAESVRGIKPSTAVGYRSILEHHLKPEFGARRLGEITRRDIESWRDRQVAVGRRNRVRGRTVKGLSPRNANAVLAAMHGVFKHAVRCEEVTDNPVRDIEPLGTEYDPMRYPVYSPDEVHKLARAAGGQDGAMIVVSAFTGLRRGELIALQWKHIDFGRSTVHVQQSYSKGHLTTPKSKRVRAVPMAPEVAEVLTQLRQRGQLTGPDDLVFLGEGGRYVDGSALRRRYQRAQKAAGLPLHRWHDLRHTFGTLAVDRASERQVQGWMGHADSRTTARYLHHKDRAEDAELLSDAFRVSAPEVVAAAA